MKPGQISFSAWEGLFWRKGPVKGRRHWYVWGCVWPQWMPHYLLGCHTLSVADLISLKVILWKLRLTSEPLFRSQTVNTSLWIHLLQNKHIHPSIFNTFFLIYLPLIWSYLYHKVCHGTVLIWFNSRFWDWYETISHMPISLNNL